MTKVCFLCSAELVPGIVVGGGVVVDVEEHTVHYRGESVRLTADEARFLSAVVHAYPRPVTYERIMHAIYEGDTPAAAGQIISVHSCRVNEKIMPLGLKIASDRSVGTYGQGDGGRILKFMHADYDEVCITTREHLSAKQARVVADSAASTRCPECDTVLVPDTVENEGIALDLRRRTVSRAGRCVYLSPRQTVLLSVLLRVYPKTASLERVCAVLFPDPDNAPEGLRRLVDVFTCQLRKKLKHTIGISFYSKYGNVRSDGRRGIRIEELPVELPREQLKPVVYDILHQVPSYMGTKKCQVCHTILESLLTKCGIVVDTEMRSVTHGAKRVDLTPKQTKVLALILYAHPAYVTMDQIWSSAWGGEYSPQAYTLTAAVLQSLNKQIKTIGLCVTPPKGGDSGGHGLRKLTIEHGAACTATVEDTHEHIDTDLDQVVAVSAASTRCPECGTVLIPDRVEKRGITVDLRTNTVSRENRCRQLTRMQAVLLSVLLRAYPSTVSHEHLFAVLWPDPDNAPDALREHVRVMVYQLGRELKHTLGISSLSEYGRSQRDGRRGICIEELPALQADHVTDDTGTAPLVDAGGTTEAVRIDPKRKVKRVCMGQDDQPRLHPVELVPAKLDAGTKDATVDVQHAIPVRGPTCLPCTREVLSLNETVERNGILFDQENRIVYRGEAQVVLTEKQSSIFAALFRMYPKLVAPEELAQLYQGWSCNVATVWVHVRTLSARLAPLGMHIRRSAYTLLLTISNREADYVEAEQFRCTRCGTSLTSSIVSYQGVTINLDTGFVSRGGATVRLSHMPLTILHECLKEYPNEIPYTQVLNEESTNGMAHIPHINRAITTLNMRVVRFPTRKSKRGPAACRLVLC